VVVEVVVEVVVQAVAAAVLVEKRRKALESADSSAV
jgi:hypothetical protein